MCENVKATLELLKQKKSNLTKGEIVVVFQQVVYDLNKQGERMTELEKRMTSLEEKTDRGFEKINEKLDTLQRTIDEEKKKPSFWERIPILKEVPTVVWLILWTIVIAACCLLGVNPSFIQYMKGG